MNARARFADSALQNALPTSLRERLADFWELSKPGITSLVAICAAAGFYLGSNGMLPITAFLVTVIGVAMVSAGAGALNEFVERELDSKMKRTLKRPLPAGRLVPRHGLIYGIALGVVGTVLLIAFVNLLTAVLTASTLLVYLFAYTPLKRRSTVCTLVGAIPGAAPPLLGWVGAKGAVGLEGIILFLILFFWQMPHFFALAWMYKKDYAEAGFRMVSVFDKTGGRTAWFMLLNAAALLPISLLPTMAGITGTAYFVFAGLSGLVFLAFTVVFAMTRSQVQARRTFLGSILHLPLLLIVMVVDKVV